MTGLILFKNNVLDKMQFSCINDHAWYWSVWKMQKINVMVADDHPAILEGLCRRLTEEDDIEVVARSTDGKEAVQIASKLKPDVAILDVAMPHLDGVEAARLIKASSPQTAVLMYSAYGYESYILGALRAGAAGYLMKDIPMRELVGAIRIVNRGESVFDFRAAKDIVRRLTSDKSYVRKYECDLHPRELQVLKLAAKGTTNKEIATTLKISRRTVQSHLANIYQKLNVSSRTEAVLSALKKGWITTNDLP